MKFVLTNNNNNNKILYLIQINKKICIFIIFIIFKEGSIIGKMGWAVNSIVFMLLRVRISCFLNIYQSLVLIL